MRYQGTAPARQGGDALSQRELERSILNMLMAEGVSSVWVLDELEHEFADAGVCFGDAIAALACADVIHTYGPFIKLSRASMRTSELTDLIGSE